MNGPTHDHRTRAAVLGVTVHSVPGCIAALLPFTPSGRAAGSADVDILKPIQLRDGAACLGGIQNIPAGISTTAYRIHNF